MAVCIREECDRPAVEGTPREFRMCARHILHGGNAVPEKVRELALASIIRPVPTSYIRTESRDRRPTEAELMVLQACKSNPNTWFYVPLEFAVPEYIDRPRSAHNFKLMANKVRHWTAKTSGPYAKSTEGQFKIRSDGQHYDIHIAWIPKEEATHA